MKIVRVSAMWCMSCLSMKKTWKKVFSEYKDLQIIDLDFDFNTEEVKKYNIGSILPELVFFDNEGNELKRIIGEKSKKEMYKLLEDLDEKI